MSERNELTTGNRKQGPDNTLSLRVIVLSVDSISKQTWIPRLEMPDNLGGTIRGGVILKNDLYRKYRLLLKNAFNIFQDNCVLNKLPILGNGHFTGPSTTQTVPSLVIEAAARNT